MKKPTPPKILDAMVAVVLAYRPKPKTKSAKKRKKRAVKIAREKTSSHDLLSRNRAFDNNN
jgi:hypothetical protein